MPKPKFGLLYKYININVFFFSHLSDLNTRIRCNTSKILQLGKVYVRRPWPGPTIRMSDCLGPRSGPSSRPSSSSWPTSLAPHPSSLLSYGWRGEVRETLYVRFFLSFFLVWLNQPHFMLERILYFFSFNIAFSIVLQWQYFEKNYSLIEMTL